MTNELKWFRGDITGLRTLAIVPVVAFHAGITGLSGGFVGVDIFYVISGFLITTILVREVSGTGRLRLGNFWGKRLRRLAPALGLMVLVTLPIAALVTSPLRWQTLGTDAGSSLVYLSNFVFAQSSTDYFAEALGQSPYIHTWSLGVEEQFYVVWPALIVLGAVIAKRRGIALVVILRVAFAVTILISFALSIWMTETHPAWAFYLLPTRAWEFAAAGLLATLPLERVIRRRWISTAVALVGLFLIVVSFFTIKETDPFPGWIAAVPVVGTLLVIAGGTSSNREGQGMVSRMLDTRPMRWIGDVSYSWYLWHWPFIVLAAVIFGDQLLVKLSAALASLAIAYLAYRFIENPIRFSPFLTSSLRRTFLTLGAATAVIGVLCASLVVLSGSLLQQDRYEIYAQASDYIPQQHCPADAKTGLEVCVLGDLSSDKVVMLVGDSHSGHWQDAMGAAAESAGVKLLSRWKSSCPAIAVTVADTANHVDSTCAEFQRGTLELAEHYQPSAVIVSQAAAYDGRIRSSGGDQIPEAEQRQAWSSAYDRLLDELAPNTGTVAAILDNPRLHFDPNECATRLWHSPSDCTSSREAALDQVSTLNTLSAQALQAHDVTDVLDFTDEICGSTTCPVVDADGVPIYRDYNHLSLAWTLTKVPALTGWLAEL